MLSVFLYSFFLWHLHSEPKSDVAQPEDIRPAPSQDVLAAKPEDNQDEACRDLKPGESREVDEPSRVSPFRLERAFRVTRNKKQPHVYEVDVPMQFRPTQIAMAKVLGRFGGGGRDSREGDIEGFMLNRANQCFSELRDRLRDPDGNVFRLRIAPKALDPKTAPRVVAVTDIRRANSLDWNSGLSCETIVHETLHHLGLVDQYQETDTAAIPGRWFQKAARLYDCRLVSARPTVMGQPLLEGRSRIAFCNCNWPRCTSQAPIVIESKTPTLNCPDGYWLSPPIKDMTDADWSAHFKAVKSPTAYVRYRIALPEVTLLRAEAQFIIKPHCTRDNNYLACVQNAYRTSLADKCLPLPESCAGGLE